MANVYSCQVNLNLSSTTGEVLSLGFGASFLRIFNPSGVDCFVNFAGNAATCRDHVVKTGATFESPIPRLRTIALTTTSTGASGQLVHVVALGE